jgi:hypothetical protein
MTGRWTYRVSAAGLANPRGVPIDRRGRRIS